ncbi:DUF4870 family protein [Acuticoccus sediminis]|uniref:DUF4870 family protein n=1 Tax=Acuticoccus sediminis TaxID=2184697 RepID=UPI001CFCEEB0|nr:hypothetical protein [Acuticoccus sediminis]
MSDKEPPQRPAPAGSGPSVPTSGAKKRKAPRTRTAKGPAGRPHLPETTTPEKTAPETAASDPRAPRTHAAEPRQGPAKSRRQPRIEAAEHADQPGMVNAKLIYAAYLTSPALPIAAVAAFAFAHYARRRQPPAWLASHYTYQIRTFWGAAAGYVASVALSFAGGGVIVYPLVAVWLVARSVHGIVRAAHARPIDDPEAFLV